VKNTVQRCRKRSNKAFLGIYAMAKVLDFAVQRSHRGGKVAHRVAEFLLDLIGLFGERFRVHAQKEHRVEKADLLTRDATPGLRGPGEFAVAQEEIEAPVA
jgi:hypothetical protein